MAKADHKKILPVWQPVGYSTYQITNAISDLFKEKATHTGVLDPLAEGVILILLGPERFKKSEHTDTLKGYEFDITFGIKTDSYDGMGLIVDFTAPISLQRAKIENALRHLIGDYVQEVPLYSARKVSGKKLFLYPKENQIVPKLPQKSGQIYKLEYCKFREKMLFDLVEENIKNVKKVEKGEYRQDKIIKAWRSFAKENQNQKIQTVSFYVELSRGLYVRSLSQDIAGMLGTIGFVSRLVRTKNGPYNRENSQTLDNIFGKKFDHKLLQSKFSM